MLIPFFTKTFKLKDDEGLIFSLLFFHSFFLVGGFISFFFVPANSIFVHNFGNETLPFFNSDYLPFAYITAGIMGYLATTLYSWLQKRINSKYLFLGAMIFMTFISVFICVLLATGVNEKWLSFFTFIFAWPFISLAGIVTGGLSLRIFNLRQVKRLFGAVNIGGIIASIICYFAVPVLMPFLSHPYDLFYFAAGSALISIFILIALYKKIPDSFSQQVTPKVDRTSRTTFRQLFKEKYFALIFLSATLSWTLLYFSDFAYLSSVKQSPYIETAAEVSNFIAIVCAVFKIGEFIVSYFSSRLLTKYGVKLGLTILPFTATILILFATITAFTLGTQSIVYFAFIVLNKSFERIWRRGLDDPSFNILYQPLPAKQQLEIQTKVGIVQQMSIGIGGFLLLIVSSLLSTESGVNLQLYNLFYLPLLFLWSFLSLKLYGGYKKQLRQILSDKGKNIKRDMYSYFYGTEILTKKFKKFNTNVVRQSVVILSETNPRSLELYASSILEKRDPTTIKSILRYVDPTWPKKIKKVVTEIEKTTNETEIKKLIQLVKHALDYKQIFDPKIQNVDEIIEKGTIEEKYNLIKYLYKSRNQEEYAAIIPKLLEDPNKRVKLATLNLISKKNLIPVKERLIELIASDEYYHIVSMILLESGGKIIDDLDNLIKENQSPDFIIRIIEMYAKIGSKSAKSKLIELINFPNRNVQQAVIRALYFCRYQASDAKELTIVRKKLEGIIENITWLLTSISEIEAEKNTLKLIQALDDEREKNYELVFKFLSFIYNPRIISLIKKNIIGENTIFALEIIDNFVGQDVKNIIIPLFDNISLGQRIKKLQKYYPQEKMTFSGRLKDIICRDYDKIEPWTVAKAVELLGKIHKRKNTKALRAGLKYDTNTGIELWTRTNVIKLLEKIRKSEMPDEIFVSLYHYEEIVYSSAAQIIYLENPSRCYNYLNNLSDKKKQIYDILADETSKVKRLLVDRVRYLKRVPLFFSIPENILMKVAKLLEPISYEKDEKIYFEDENNQEYIYLVLSGSIYFIDIDGNRREYKRNSLLIRELNIEEKAEYITTIENSILFKTTRVNYFNVLIDETDIIQHIFDMIQTDNELIDLKIN